MLIARYQTFDFLMFNTSYTVTFNWTTTIFKDYINNQFSLTTLSIT